MKAVILDIEGTVSTGVVNARRRNEAALEALHRCGFRVTQEAFNEALQSMRAARADKPNEAALWQLFRPLAVESGLDAKRRATDWQTLLDEFRGLAGYKFEERPGIRALLEELRFNTVDQSGDVPLIIAVSDRGEFVRDALEQARLAPLFDAIRIVNESGPRAGDPRFLTEVAAAFQLPHLQCVVVGARISTFLGAASALSMATLRFPGEADAGLPARGPWEEPDYEAATATDMSEMIVEWINAPVRARRR